MAENTEPKQAEEQQAQDTEPTIPKSAIRSHPFFKEVTGKQSEELAAVKAELDAFKAAVAEEKEAQRKAKMEEEGNYKQLIAEEKAAREALEAAHAKQLVTMQLENKLAHAMKTENDIWLRGAVASYDGDADGVADYVAALQADEANKPIFEGPTPTGHKGPSPAVPATGPVKINWAQVYAERDDRSNPGKALKAVEQIEAYIRQNGEPPPH